jgi:hypothetical protein
MTYAQAQSARWEELTTLVNSWDCREELDTYVGDQGTGRDIPGTYGMPIHNIQAGHQTCLGTVSYQFLSFFRGHGLYDHV